MVEEREDKLMTRPRLRSTIPGNTILVISVNDRMLQLISRSHVLQMKQTFTFSKTLTSQSPVRFGITCKWIILFHIYYKDEIKVIFLFLCHLSNQHSLGAVRELNEELWVVIAHPHIVD